MTPQFLRATQLMQLGRHGAAEQELRQVLAEHPDFGEAHSMLAICLLEREQFDAAQAEAQTAVGLEADDDLPHFVQARIWRARNYPDRALQSIDEAIRLRADDPANHALRAGILCDRRQWSAALEAAEQGLQLDAENGDCNQIRAMALVQLGRRDEAAAGMEAVLARNPEDSYNHAVLGHTRLDGGDVRGAMEHFREALRLDPTNEFARAGIVEALKARNPIYRTMLTAGLWLVKLPRSAQWGLLVGMFVAYRMLKSFAAGSPEWGPWVEVLLSAIIALSWCSFFAVPVFNMLLRFDRDGRHALSDEQVRESNWLISLLGLYLALYGASYVPIPGMRLLRIPALLVLGLIVPVGFYFDCAPGSPRRTMFAFIVFMAAMAGAILILPFAGFGSSAILLFRVYGGAMLISLLLGFWQSQVRPKK